MSDSPQHSTRRLDRAFLGGVAWSAGAKWSTQLVTWGTTFLLARLLTPGDFGLVSMAGAFLALSNVLAEFGLGSAVVQMQDLGRDVLKQLNALAVMISGGMFLLAVLLAPAIAAFYGEQKVQWVFASSALMLLITGFNVVPVGIIRRDMNYKVLSIAEAVQALVQAGVTVTAAFAGLAYWSLVVGYLAGNFAALAVVLYRAGIGFQVPRWGMVQPAFRYGWHVSTSNLAAGAYSQSAAMVIGRQLGQGAAGSYQMAGALAMAPLEKLASLVMRVTGPVFARSQNDLPLIRRYFFIFVETLTMLVLPIASGAAIVATDLVGVLLGAQWGDVAGPMRWLCLLMLLRVMITLMDQVLNALWHTSFVMKRGLLLLCILPPAFFAATGWGLWAVAAAWLLILPVNALPSWLRLQSAAGFELPDLFKALRPAVLSCAFMALVLFWLRTSMEGTNFPLQLNLLMQVGVGGLAYVSFILVFFRRRVFRYIEFLRDLRRDQSTPDPKVLNVE